MSKILNKLLPRTFTRQIILLIAALGIIAALTNLTISGYYEYKFLKRNMDATLTNQFQAVSRIFAEAVIYNNIYDLYTRAEAMVRFLDFVDNIYIFDGTGDYLTDAKVLKDIKNISGIGSENISVYNLDAGSERVGYVVYALNGDYIFNTLREHLLGLAVFEFLLLIAGLATGVVISAFLTKPLDMLVVQLKNLSSLRMKLKLPNYAPEEVRLLAGTLNNLSQTVSEQEKKIVRGERLASIGTMAAGLAHQLKNPIMTIELLTHCIPEKRDNEEDMEVIRRESAHITSILDEFLNLSKPLNLTFTEIHTKEFVGNLQSFIESRFKGKLKLTADMSEDFVFTCDSGKLADIFINLINNSFEAGSRAVNLSVYQSGEELKIKFSDDGRGIPEDIRERIFYPFFTSKSSGTGLGLAYSEMIIEAMQGRIEFAPSPIGATFIVTLPLEYP